jgi:hypothetical protein
VLLSTIDCSRTRSPAPPTARGPPSVNTSATCLPMALSTFTVTRSTFVTATGYAADHHVHGHTEQISHSAWAGLPQTAEEGRWIASLAVDLLPPGRPVYETPLANTVSSKASGERRLANLNQQVLTHRRSHKHIILVLKARKLSLQVTYSLLQAAHL